MTSVSTGLVALAGAGVASALATTAYQRRRRYLPGSALALDVRRAHPLRPALRLGFAAVEIPVQLGERGLVVGEGDADPWRGLGRLVLEPLAAQVSRGNGRIFVGQSEPLTLLLRLSDPEGWDRGAEAHAVAAYRRLDELLRGYPGLVTHWYRGGIALGPVTVLLTGGYWTGDLVAAESDRLVFADGTFADLGRSALPPSVIPLVSEDWSWRFGWDGSEAMAPEERQLLRALVGAAHRDGRGVRMTGGPTAHRRVRAAYWRELVAAGVDLIGTDREAALARFLRRADRPEREPAGVANPDTLPGQTVLDTP